jgi:hypothetical protein
MSFEL